MTGMFSRRLARAGLAVLVVAVATSGCAYVSRVSDSGSPTSPLAGPAAGGSDSTSLSSNGQFIAFQSSAPDIIPNDNNGVSDVFVRDRTSGKVEAVSVSSGGTLGSGASASPQISPDGRFVVFESFATNLVLNDTNGLTDVFLRDRQAGTTVRVSVGAGGAQATGGTSEKASVSADGRYVTFISDAPNLVAGDTNDNDDLFVRDVQSGTTTRVNVGAGGVQSNGAAVTATISGDGRYIAFVESATNLVAGDTNGQLDVFVRDRQTATTTRVSVATGGAQGNGTSASQGISADGRYVVFSSDATNLVTGDTNATNDVFVRDRTTATTTRVSVATGGAQANGPSNRPAISSDGRYVAFSSRALSLGGTAEGTVYRRDRTGGTTIAVSKSTAGAFASGTNNIASISGDGSIVGFTSAGTNVVPQDLDRNGVPDVFDRVIATNTTELVSRHGSFQGNGGAAEPSMSSDGRYVAFTSDSSDLVPNDTNGDSDVFVRDTSTGVVQLVSAAVSTGVPGAGISYDPSISSDGHWVAFTSTAPNLSPFDTNGKQDVFLRNLDTRTTRLVSVDSDDAVSDGDSSQPSISANGSFVAFMSVADNLAVNDFNFHTDVFVRDVNGTTTTRASLSNGDLEQGNGNAQDPSISPDGRFVAFDTDSDFLVTGDTNSVSDIFLYDRTAVTTTRLSVSSTGAEGDAASWRPSISADDRYVVFASDASNLVTGDTNNDQDVFVRDRQSSTTTRVSVGAGGAQGNNFSDDPTVSGDGRYIVFASFATNLVSGDTNAKSDVFVRDQVTGRTTRVSTDQNLAQANDTSADNGFNVLAPTITADGRYVAFPTKATNIVTPDANGSGFDVMIRANPVPTITSATPTTVARGATATITVNGTYFIPGVAGAFGDGITINSTTRVSESQVKFTIKVAPTAATGNRNVIVFLVGTGVGTLTGAAAQFTLKIT
jgi:Tol biopolymer transport system component